VSPNLRAAWSIHVSRAVGISGLVLLAVYCMMRQWLSVFRRSSAGKEHSFNVVGCRSHLSHDLPYLNDPFA